MKIAGSGSISQRHGSADPDPDPPQNVMDPQHWQYVQTGIYSQVDKTVLQAKMGSTACSTEYGAKYAHNRMTVCYKI